MTHKPLDLSSGFLDSVRLAKEFGPDPAIQRLVRDAASLTDTYAAAVKHLGVIHDLSGWHDGFEAVRKAQYDYVGQFTRVHETLDALVRSNQEIVGSIAQLGVLPDRWVTEAAKTQALVGSSFDLFAHATGLLSSIEGSLAHLREYELGASFGLERYKHTIDDTLRSLTSSFAAIYSADIPELHALPGVAIARPPQEVYVHVAAVEVLTVDDFEEDREDTTALEGDTKDALLPLLQKVSPVCVQKWEGARQALSSRNPDRIAHFSVSVRELFRFVLHHAAPDDKLRAWSTAKEDYDKGRPTRAARFRFATRAVAHPPFSAFLAKDFSATLELITLFDRGVHEGRPDITDAQARLMMLRMDQFLRFLLEMSRESDS